MFGFHVHEKTILLPLIWILIDIPIYGVNNNYMLINIYLIFLKKYANSYITFAGITLYPLMKEDGLAV